MRGLLDVNVLIALLDRDHALHQRALAWFAANAPAGWASCPLTQNGCVRVMSHSGYPNRLPVVAHPGAVARGHRQFLPRILAGRRVAARRAGVADATRIHGSRQITDLYLLALAVRHEGTFVTFDRSIALEAVRGATKRHLAAL